MTKTFEEEVKEAYERASINLYGNIAGSIGMKKLLNELKDTGFLKEQQALPVVPEDVAKLPGFDDMKEYVLDERLLAIRELLNKLDEKSNNDITEAEAWCLTHEHIVYRAMLDGYTVEKPQLFYLKHIDMSRKDKEFDHYLFRIEGDRLAHHIVNKNNLPHNYRSITFTQQEIDSMQTGSYQQIEVTE